jgi:Uma2 family endonuclease
MTTRTRKITVDEFWEMADDPSHRYELVDGELADMDGKPKHGRVTARVGSLLQIHIFGCALPLDVGVNTGFAMSATTLRFPDVHVTPWERLAEYDESVAGWPRLAPDVAIEVVSDSNSPTELDRKTAEYFANGTRAVWIADPDPRTVKIRKPGQPERIFGPGDVFTGEPEIPGFSCAVADIFAVLDRAAASRAEVG